MLSFRQLSTWCRNFYWTRCCFLTWRGNFYTMAAFCFRYGKVISIKVKKKIFSKPFESYTNYYKAFIYAWYMLQNKRLICFTSNLSQQSASLLMLYVLPAWVVSSGIAVTSGDVACGKVVSTIDGVVGSSNPEPLPLSSETSNKPTFFH